MKKKICSFMLAVALTFQAVSFRAERAHAILGIATGAGVITASGVALLAIGAGMLIGGGVWLNDIESAPGADGSRMPGHYTRRAGYVPGRYVDDHAYWRRINDAPTARGFMTYSVMPFFWGIVLLDEETGAVSFDVLGDEVIAAAHLTEDENAAYHLELPELNRALYAGAADLVAQGYTTAEEAMAHPEFWQARAANLMPETRSALTKLGAYAQARAQAN